MESKAIKTLQIILRTIWIFLAALNSLCVITLNETNPHFGLTIVTIFLIGMDVACLFFLYQIKMRERQEVWEMYRKEYLDRKVKEIILNSKNHG